MKILSLRQPWASLIVTEHPRKSRTCLKDIENRKWPVPKKYTFPFDFYVHASKTYDHDSFPELRKIAKLMGQSWIDFYGDAIKHHAPLGCIIGRVTVINCVRASESPWFVGPYGFELMEPIRFLNPFPYSGRLGFWDIEDELADQIWYEGMRMS